MHIVAARVIRGESRGCMLGFPTANLQMSRQLVAPPNGIYSAWALVGRRWHRAAVSVGKNKTFRATRATIEAHLLDFRGDLYGKEMSLVFVKRLREMKKFPSVAQLVHQVKKDIQTTKTILVTSY